ncbi:MAG: hypothetical protein VXY35_01210 [Candidatus Thermoplasmatota archaeon]|nr:hypothetical protein [Candidatus Thermoplasmatota archaeon]
MRTQAIGLILLLILAFPLQSVTAEEDDETLEARETWAEFFPDSESTILQWRNIETTDGLLLDQLKMATYEVHRTENGRFFTNAITPETIVAEDIPACYMNDLNEDCSGKVHTFVYEPAPGTSGEVSYAVVTVLRDGMRTEAVNVGMSQIPGGHREVVPASVAPELFAAQYDVANQSTVFTWRPSCAGNNFYHSLYEHSVPATKSTWAGMDKTLVTNFIPATSSQFTLDWTNQSIDREVYYTLTCFYPPYCDDFGCYPAREDTRLHSANSLTSPIIEDNQAPRYGGSLIAQFNPSEFQTVLQWSEVTQSDIAKIRIYHATSPIVSLEQNGVQVLAELDTTSVEFIHQLSDDWMLTSYYAIGLVDTRGNIQIDQFDVSGKVGPILERNLPISISELNIEQDNSTLHFEWNLDARFISGDAILWTSTSSNPDMTPAWEELTRLNPKTLEHHMTFEEMGEAWYALTLEGTWGASPGPHIDDRILLGQNAVYFAPQEQPENPATTNDSSAIEFVDLPEFLLRLTDENLSLSNGDWVTLQSQTNDNFTLRFTHSQTNSTIRWTDALNTNPFWSSASQTGDDFSIKVEEPVNLIHIESTNVNGEIHIVRIGIDWPEEEIVQPNNSSDSQLVDNKEASAEDSVSLPLLLIIGVIAAYILIIVSMKGNEESVFTTEEE